MNISLTDPILTAIATDALDDTSNPAPPVKMPPPAQGKAALSMRRTGDLAIFTVGTLGNGAPIEVQVPIVNDQIVFFPERCANQRDVMAALGLG